MAAYTLCVAAGIWLLGLHATANSGCSCCGSCCALAIYQCAESRTSQHAWRLHLALTMYASGTDRVDRTNTTVTAMNVWSADISARFVSSHCWQASEPLIPTMPIGPLFLIMVKPSCTYSRCSTRVSSLWKRLPTSVIGLRLTVERAALENTRTTPPLCTIQRHLLPRCRLVWCGVFSTFRQHFCYPSHGCSLSRQ